IALSRYSGALVGLKLVNETAEGTAILESTPLPAFIRPEIPEPPGGVHIRAEMLAVQAQEARLQRHKFARACLRRRQRAGSRRFRRPTAAFPDCDCGQELCRCARRPEPVGH